MEDETGKRVFEGWVEHNWAGIPVAIDHGREDRMSGHTTTEQWFRELDGKKVRLTVEVLE